MRATPSRGDFTDPRIGASKVDARTRESGRERKDAPKMNSWASGSMFPRRPPMNKRVDRSRSTRFGNSPNWTRNPEPRCARRRIRVPSSRTRRSEAEAEARFRPRLRTDAFRPTASGGRTGSKENRPGGKLACLRADSRSSPVETASNSGRIGRPAPSHNPPSPPRPAGRPSIVSGLPGAGSADERHQELVELRDDRWQVRRVRHAHLAEEGCPLRLLHRIGPEGR